MADRRISDPGTVNEIIQDQNIRHRLGLDQVSGKIRNDVVSLLNEADEDIVRILNNRVPRLTEGMGLSRHLRDLRKELKGVLGEITGDVFDKIEDRVKDVAKNEATYQTDLFKRAIPVEVEMTRPSSAMLESLVTTQPFEGRTLREWGNKIESTRLKDITNQVRLGVLEGESTPQIVNRVKGSRTASFRDGVLQKGRREVAGVVRTSVTEFSEKARERIYQQNRSIVKGVKYVATLDKRTTIQCASKDGEVYKPGSGPRPPLHYQCRSTTSPVVKSWQEMGLNGEEMDASSRASMNGQVPETNTFESWLKDRDPGEVKEVLGKSRAKLWKDGGLDLDDFVRGDREVMNLDALRVQQSEAFEKAGL